MNGDGHTVSGNLQGRSLGLLQQIGLDGAGRPGRHAQLDAAALPCPLVQVKDERVAVLGLLHGSEHYVVGRD